jgi:hypothetical protein
LLNSMRARSQAFDEPLSMRRQRFEISDANGVVPKSPGIRKRNDSDCH